jgi:hypothetical protein
MKAMSKTEEGDGGGNKRGWRCTVICLGFGAVGGAGGSLRSFRDLGRTGMGIKVRMGRKKREGEGERGE